MPFRAFSIACLVVAMILALPPSGAFAQDGATPPPPPLPPIGQRVGPRPNGAQEPPDDSRSGAPSAPAGAPEAASKPAAQASSLPATQPTALVTATPQPVAATPPTTPAKHAEVIYENGLLEVKANDSSLNQILHLISRRTGMIITGGVSEQRVFGDYGPTAPSTVLATLLDGTGTNMVLRESANQAPVELILTQRNGGPTPPSPNQAQEDDAVEERPAAQASPQPQTPSVTSATPVATQPASSQPLNNPLGSPTNTSPTAATLNTANSVSTDSIPSPTTAAQPAQGIVDAPNPPPPGSTSDANGTVNSTPEQIYQQLLKMQQQKSTTTTPPPNTTTTTPPQ